MEKQNNKVVPIVTGVVVSSMAVFLHEQYRQGTLQVWLKELKKSLLSKHNVGGFDSNRNYIPLDLEERFTTFPDDKTYIMLHKNNRS